MSLLTRLDPRSENNNKLTLKDPDGNVIAEIKATGEKGTTLEINTIKGFYVEKDNGWSSKRRL